MKNVNINEVKEIYMFFENWSLAVIPIKNGSKLQEIYSNVIMLKDMEEVEI
jgi:hypothetical protein